MSRLFVDPDQVRQWVPPELERRSSPRAKNEDPDAIRESARKAGFAEGLQAAEVHMKAQQLEFAQQFDAFLENFSKPFKRLDAEVEAALSELALVLAQGLLRAELTVNPDHVLEAARDAIAALPQSDRKLQLVMHPQDAALAKDLLVNISADRNVTVCEDPDLARGGCRVEAEFASVDATVDARVKAIAERLRAGLEIAV